MRRKAIEIETLSAEAPKLIHAMLVGIVEKKSRSALIGLIEPTKAKMPEAASLSSHELALSPKAKLVEFAKKAGVPNEKIQDALNKDNFFADPNGDGQKVSASGAATAPRPTCFACRLRARCVGALGIWSRFRPRSLETVVSLGTMCFQLSRPYGNTSLHSLRLTSPAHRVLPSIT